MTTIAYKDRIVCADTIVVAPVLNSFTTKIYKSADGVAIAGVAGSCLQADIFWEWFKTAEYKDYSKFKFTYEENSGYATEACLLYIEDGIEYVRWYNNAGNCLTRVSNSIYALGSGEEFALGAMYAGATAYDAVKVTSILTKDTNDIITKLTLDLTY